MRVLWLGAGLLLLSACAQDTSKLAVLPAVYCYHTIGWADCYDAPQESQTTRLISYYGPAPQNRGFVGR